jgi:hypothetical protein
MVGNARDFRAGLGTLGLRLRVAISFAAMLAAAAREKRL